MRRFFAAHRLGFRSIVCITLWLLLLAVPANAFKGGKLYAFGDSGIDTGNIYASTSGATPDSSLGYWEGRFCNGPNYLDQLADSYTTWNSIAALLGGTNCAFGGAESGSGDSATYGVPNLQKQIVLFLADHPGFAFANEDVILISTGHNDMLSNKSSPPDPATIAQYVLESVVALQALGGRCFIIPTTIPIHLSPSGADGISSADARAWLVSFNSALDSKLAALQSASPELTFVRTDLFTRIEGIYNNKSAYGVTNVTDSSYNGLGTPATYLWFDNCHVTSFIGSYIAQWILNDLRVDCVPAMSAYWYGLMGGLLLIVGILCRHSRFMQSN